MTREAAIRQRPVFADKNSSTKNQVNENNENRWFDDLHPVLRRILLARGITRPEELSLNLHSMLPPGGLSGIDRAAMLVAEAVMQGKRILVVGDFDADQPVTIKIYK